MRYRHRILALVTLALCLFAAPARAAEVTMVYDNQQWKVTMANLEAIIGADGCMTSLRLPFPNESWVHVPNFFKPGIGLPRETGAGGSRGAYCYQDEILTLPEITREGENVLVAQSAKAAVRYDFAPAQLTWTVTNKTDAPLQFFMVIDPTVQAVRGAQGEYLKTPVIRLWPESTWFQGKRRLHISGGSRLWGPGPVIGQDWRQAAFQVWEALLAPRETRRIVLTPGVATAEEATTLAGVAPEVPFRGTAPTPMAAPKAAVDGALTLYAPRDYQVFQRQTRTRGAVLVAGQLRARADRVEARLTGAGLTGALPGTWQALPLDPVTLAFRAELPTPAGGWYRLELRALTGGAETLTAQVAHVGVGEVFVGCGQSNSTNCGAAPTKVQSGMVATFSGLDWRIADDPQPGTHDTSALGSFWPAFGDAMYARYRVPIGVAVTGQGGAPVRTWQPGQPAFAWLMTRILALGVGGFRAVLWHQGESDVRGTSEAYAQQLATTIAGSYAVAGWKFPWFVARVSYLNPKEPRNDSTRNAQQQLCDTGIALPGPDTDTLIGPDRDGIHLSLTGLRKHGDMWAEQVGTYLDTALTP